MSNESRPGNVLWNRPGKSASQLGRDCLISFTMKTSTCLHMMINKARRSNRSYIYCQTFSEDHRLRSILHVLFPISTRYLFQSNSYRIMPKRRADAPLGQSPPEGPADVNMADQDGSIAPRNSLEQGSNDRQAESFRSDPRNLERPSTHAEESEDITMGNTGSKEQIEAFTSSLTSKLDAVKDGRLGDAGAGNTKGQEKQKDKDEERHQKKKRSEAEEGAGSGRYTTWY